MLSQSKHQNRVEEICLGQIIYLPPGESHDVLITPQQLRQLLIEGLIHPQFTYNNRPPIIDFMRFAETIDPFLQKDTQLQLRFQGSLSRWLGNHESSIHLTIDTVDLKMSDGHNIDQATDILPIFTQFIVQDGQVADDFKLTLDQFWAWWD